MRRLLITGYDPFGGEHINPAWEAVKILPDQIGDLTLHKLEIPTRFGDAFQAVLQAAEEIRPHVILCVGQAGGRGAVTPERIGINLRHARICDNAGFMPTEQAILPEGPAAYFATVPVSRMVKAIEDASLPGAASCTAGTFVCNETLYLLLHHYANTSVQVGFIHVPWLPEQGSPSLPLERTAAALEAAIGAI